MPWKGGSSGSIGVERAACLGADDAARLERSVHVCEERLQQPAPSVSFSLFAVPLKTNPGLQPAWKEGEMVWHGLSLQQWKAPTSCTDQKNPGLARNAYTAVFKHLT